MKRFCRAFQTTAEYNDYMNQRDKLFPNVSICKDIPVGGGTSMLYNMHYNEAPDYVDLGLPSGNIWMKHLLGMHSDTDIENALYFQWGDTIGYTRDTADGKIFNYTTYKYCNGSNTTFTKYTSAEYGYDGFSDNKMQLDIEDDAVHFIHQKWRMPTLNDFLDLINGTTTEYTTLTGIYGIKFTSKYNSNYIFLPCIGYRNSNTISNDGTHLYLFSASRTPNNSAYAQAMYITGNTPYCTTFGRCGGCSLLGIKIQN